MNRPNIIFFHVDQLNTRAMSGEGCKDVATPNLDRLYSRGLVFDQAIAANPTCMPSRTSWYTGLMSEEHGQIDNGKPGMDPSVPDIGPLVTSGGYDSVFFGKWHVNKPVEKSFDMRFVGHGCGEVGDAYTARAAEAFLANREGDKPFFLNVGLLNPHDCCMWGYDFVAFAGIGKYSLAPSLIDQLPQLPPNHYLSCMPTMPEYGVDPARHHWTDLQWRYYMWCYYRQVEMVDFEIGRVMSALENSQFRDNTVLIFASDHGDGVAQHYHYGKGSPLDPSLRIPFVVVAPGTAPGRDKTHSICNIDVTATICDYAGVDPLPGRKGLSFRPIVEAADPNSLKYRPYAPACAGFDGRNRIIRTSTHKLVNDRKNGSSVMYDLVKDPWEMTNVFDDPTCVSTRRQLQAYMDANEATYHYAPGTIDRFNRFKDPVKGIVI